MVSTESQLDRPERRTQSRVRIQIPLTIRLLDQGVTFSATSHDLSWGGLLFTLSDQPQIRVGPIHVELPWRRDERIEADATVLRSSPLSDGGCVVAARFVSLSFANQSRLERLLKTLQATAAPRDCSGPDALVRELEVDVQDTAEMRRMLGQIASGRHQVTVFEPYSRGQSICLSIGGMGNQPVLRLRARVADSHKATMQGYGWAQPYELTLEFEHPHETIELIVKRLVGTSGDSGRDTSPPTSAVLQVPERPQVLCALEERFPELLTMLTAAWCDAQAFQALATDLLPADTSQPGAWPHDVWEELIFLCDMQASRVRGDSSNTTSV